MKTQPRTCYDSTNAHDLPRTADVALAYVDGLYGTDATASPRAVARQCPHARVVTVTVTGRTHAHMIDCETGDVSPAGAAAAVKAGVASLIYFPTSWHDQVVAACKAHGLKPGRDVWFFAARYGADRTIPPGYVGVQYSSPDGPVGTRPPGHYDVSVVAGYLPTVDPKPRLPRLGHGKRATARALTRELRRRKVPVPRKDRALLLALLAQIRRLLGRTKP